MIEINNIKAEKSYIYSKYEYNNYIPEMTIVLKFVGTNKGIHCQPKFKEYHVIEYGKRLAFSLVKFKSFRKAWNYFLKHKDVYCVPYFDPANYVQK